MNSPDHEGLSGDDAERFDRAMHALHRPPVRVPTSVREGIMRRIREMPTPVGSARRAWTWLLSPRQLQSSPLALAAVLLVLLSSTTFITARIAREQPPVAGAIQGPRIARFMLVAPTASAVALTGSFVNWDRTGLPLRRLADGLWVAEVPLSPGIYHYVFVIDGRDWRPDPNAAWNVDDGLGRQNSVLVVPGPERS